MNFNLNTCFYLPGLIGVGTLTFSAAPARAAEKPDAINANLEPKK